MHTIQLLTLFSTQLSELGLKILPSSEFWINDSCEYELKALLIIRYFN